MAALLSSILLAVVTSVFAYLHGLGLREGLPSFVTSAMSAGVIYVALYWLFDRYAWRWPRVPKLLRVPNIAGNWLCQGQTFSTKTAEQYSWTGNVIIVQSWDKIRVVFTTPNSGSTSVAAALQWDTIAGYRLLYHYRNHPNIDQLDLTAHHGFAEIVFSSDLKSASGEYFNGRGRSTYGTMKLRKEAL